jgi:hypothetical protein
VALRQYRAIEEASTLLQESKELMSQYLLASHVYLCVTDDHVVLLDLKRDKYVGLGLAQMNALAGCVKGWPAKGTESSAEKREKEPQAFLTRMLSTGMLTTDLAVGKEAQPIAMPRPQSTLSAPTRGASSDLFATRPTLSFGHVAQFIRASVAARTALRWRAIASVVARVNLRKRRRGVSNPLDVAVARKLVAAFVYLRPLLFTTQDACLADSLALVNFLSYHDVFPTWVFGVQTGPFAAHCWVQDGDVVFNDTPDHVRRYTPILAI